MGFGSSLLTGDVVGVRDRPAGCSKCSFGDFPFLVEVWVSSHVRGSCFGASDPNFGVPLSPTLPPGEQMVQLIMEYVPLGSLRDFLPRHRVGLPRILLFAQQICEVGAGLSHPKNGPIPIFPSQNGSIHPHLPAPKTVPTPISHPHFPTPETVPAPFTLCRKWTQPCFSSLKVPLCLICVPMNPSVPHLCPYEPLHAPFVSL